jgi:hypothetical protein
MKNAQHSRRLLRKWHVREKAMLDHVVGALTADAPASAGTVHSAMTASGLCVEKQVRKAAGPSPFGLAVF